MSDPVYAAVAHDELMALRRDAERYRHVRETAAARIGIATEAFGYEKMDVPTAEWLDKAIDDEIRQG